MWTEQNCKGVLCKCGRGEEGKVEEDYHQNFPHSPFCLHASLSTVSCLPVSSWKCACFCLSPPPSSSDSLPSFSAYLSVCSESGEASLQESVSGGKKKECRSSVFSSFFHNDAEQEMEMITSSSAPLHHLLFLKPWQEALCALPNPPFRPFFLNAGGWLTKDVALIFTLHSPTS